ncbi:MAG: phage tail length tape measure family protein [Pseudorhizobium sp.]
MATENEELVLSISADTRQILNAMKRLTGEIAKSTSGIQKQFDDLGKGVDRSMTTAMQKRIDTMVGVGTNATKEWTGALAEQGKEMERLRSRFNPVFSTVTRYKTTIGEIRAAHRLGAISADEMASAIQRERQAALASIAAIKQRNAALSDTPNIPGIAGGNSFNTANIAAQFQDIGVTAAMGMNPLQIALQQGTQLSAVLNQMGSGKQVIQGLGAAFMSIVNPISLVTIGTIAATTAAAQYFLTSEDGAEAMTQSLEKQAELIQRVAQSYGDLLPQVRALAAERERLAGRQDIEDTSQIVIAETFARIKEEVASAGHEIEALMGQLRNTVPPDQIVAVQRALAALTGSAEDNSTSVEQMDAAHRALMTAFETSAVPVFRTTAEALAAMRPELIAVRDEIQSTDERAANAKAFADLQAQIDGISSAKAREEFSALAEGAKTAETSLDDLLDAAAAISGYAPDVQPLIGTLSDIWRQANATAEAVSSITSRGGPQTRGRYGRFPQLPDRAPTPGERPNDIQRLDWEAEYNERLARAGRGAGKSKEETEAERKKKAIDDVIASLKFEAEQLGRTGTEQRIYNELKRAGVDLNSENGQKIASLVTSLEKERQALEASKQALEARGKAIENLFDMGADAIGSIIDKSVSAEDAVRKLAVQLALAAAQAALFGSGPLAGLFGGGGGIFGKSIPKYGNGTNNHPGGLAIVGDKGPELLNLPRGSQVIPNVRPVAVPSAPAILGASGGGSISAPVQVTIDARGADREGLARVEQQVARLKAELPSTVVATVRQAQKTRQLR